MRHQSRAVLSLIRNPVRTLIITLMILVLSSFLVGSFLIREASGNVRNIFMSNVGPIVSLTNTSEENVYATSWHNTSHSRREMYEEYLNNVRKLSENERVRKADYSIYLRTYTDCLHNDTENWDSYFPFDSNTFYGSFFYQFICGINQPDFPTLSSNLINITSGRSITASEISEGALVCLINENLRMDDNGSKREIKPGDVIPIKLYSFYSEGKANMESVDNVFSEHTVYLEVVGIFHSNTSIINRDDESFEKRENLIYVPNPVVEKIYQMNLEMMDALPEVTSDYELSVTPGITDVVYQLREMEDLPYFLTHCQGLEEKYFNYDYRGNKRTLMITESASDAYEKAAVAIIQLEMISQSVICVISLVFAVLLVLVIIFTLNNRKKEMGILMSLGEGKIRIIRQIITEFLIIGFIGFTLSLGTGVLVAEPISREMMDTYVSRKDETMSTDDRGNQIIRYIDIDEEELGRLFEIRLSGNSIMYITALEYGLLISGLAISVTVITRVDPKKVLLG